MNVSIKSCNQCVTTSAVAFPPSNIAHEFIVGGQCNVRVFSGPYVIRAEFRDKCILLRFLIESKYLVNQFYLNVHTSSLLMTMHYLWIVISILHQGQGTWTKIFFYVFNFFHIDRYHYTPILLFCTQFHCRWQCNIHVILGLQFIWLHGQKRSFMIFIEITYLTNRFCSNFSHKFTVDDSEISKYFQSLTWSMAGSRSKNFRLYF